MIYSLTPYAKHFMLSVILTLITVGVYPYSLSPLTLPPSPNDTSKHKTHIQNCANFGQVRCSENEVGGISGFMDATNLLQCFNAGNISGSQKIGGIAGYASGNAVDSSSITYCFNSGLIGGQNYSGGIIGYLNQHIMLSKTYNIGNVKSKNYAGALVGRKFNVSSTVSECFYDCQTCIKKGIENQDVLKSAEGKFTRQMLGDSLAPIFGNTSWKYTSNYYPRLSFMDSMPAVWGMVTPLLLRENNCIDSINSVFLMQQTSNLHWFVNDSTNIQIKGNQAYILKEDSNIILSIGDGKHIFKQIPLLHTYPPICRHIALHANQGYGNMDTLTSCDNEKILLPTPSFTRPHYVFLGWGLNANNSPCFRSGDTICFNCDTTLYAIWSPDGKDSLHAVTIDNSSELMAFRDAVNNYNKGIYKGIPNASNGFKGIHFRLTANIDLDSLYKTGENWEPIGKSSTNCFKGNFHGGKHQISHLYINAPTANYKGFFGYLDSALVEDVILSIGDSIIGKQYCGGIAAFANSQSIIKRCANHAYIEGKSTHVGGICGNIGKSTIENCLNTGYIIGSEKVGGIAGYSNGNSTNYASILHCYNSGQIQAGKAAGGIIGNAYAYTRIHQVLHSGQVWADTLIGSLIGQKSQKSVIYTHGYYDRQISPVGGINGMDDSTILGKSTKELCYGGLPLGFDSLHWKYAIGTYPQLQSVDSSIASRISTQPIFFATNNTISQIKSDFDLSGCNYIQWKSSSDSLNIQTCKAYILGRDTHLVLYATSQQIIYKQIHILTMCKHKICSIKLFANDSLNSKLTQYVYENSYFLFDTLPFYKTHQIFRGWNNDTSSLASFNFGDSVLITQDTSFYAIWSNDGLSAKFALSINNLNDFIAFRDAVNDYNSGCYQGVHNQNNGYRNIYFSLNTSLNLQNQCDSLHSWVPIGKNASCNFKGNFNGNGHCIDFLIIDSAKIDYAGIFGCIDSAVISSLELGIHSSIRANNYIGGITACARNQSLVQGCANHAKIYGYGENIGGIVGYLSRSSIEECYNAADIYGKAKVGGIVGYAGTASTNPSSSSTNTSRISYCYNSNTISGNNCTGGLIGFLNGNTSLMKAYNSGQLFGQQFTGSVVGRKYNNTSNIEACFYDQQISTYGSINGKDDIAAAVGIPTKKMTGKNLENILDSVHWKYTENFYPRLSRLDSSKLAWISVVPIFLEETEHCDRVTHDFQLGSYENLSWNSSNPHALQIKGAKACILDSDTLCLTAIYEQYARKNYRIIQQFKPSKISHTETEKCLSFLVYPNPTEQYLYIEERDNFGANIQTIKLFDTHGKQLLQQSRTGQKTKIDLSRLSAGIYFLHIVDDKGLSYNYRIVKFHSFHY